MKRTRCGSFACVFLFAVVFPAFLFAQTTAADGSQRVARADMRVGAAPIWSNDLGDLVESEPYLYVESAVVSTIGGTIRSFHVTGTPLWVFEPQQTVTPFLARSLEGAVYLGDTMGVFRVLNRTGRELWRLNLENPITHPPVVGWDGRVFIPVGSTIFCHTAGGHPLWSVDLGSPIAVAPMLDRAGSIAMVLENREFVRVNQFGVVERVLLDQQPFLFVSLRDGTEDSYVLFFPNGQAEKIFFNERSPRGTRLSRASFPPPPMLPAAAASSGAQFAITLSDGRVMLMSASGQILWTGNSHETAVERGSANIDASRAAMVFDERGVYSLSTRGATGFAVDGRRRFIHRFAEANSVPGFCDDGFLFVGGRDRAFHAFMLDTRPRTVPRSRFFGPYPEGNYGMGDPPPSPWSTDRQRFDYNEQNAMLARIERAIHSGQLGESEPVYVAYLMEMVSSGLNNPGHSRVRPLVSPVRRIEFIRLLGRVGSRETVPFLWHVFDRDPHPAVRAAIAEAIGTIGVDPTGRTFLSFSFFLTPNNPDRDPQLLMSAISSIAAISRFSGPPLSADGIFLLRRLYYLNWAPPVVRAQIRNELEDLFRGEGLVMHQP